MESNKSLNSRDSTTTSLWQTDGNQTGPTNEEVSNFDPAEVYDCLIVGAGITGITSALLLQRAGKRCVLAEARQAGFGTTGGTTAHLNTFFDATYPEIESDFGEEAAKLVAKGGKEALAIISGFVEEFQIDCDFEYKQAWLYAENEKESETLNEILEATKRAGIEVYPAVKNGVPVPFDTAVCFEQQGQFHPLKYIQGLLNAFIAAGGIFLEQTRITENSFDNGIHFAKSQQVTIKASNLIFATHIPPGVNLLSFRNAAYRSYALGVTLKDGTYPEGLSYDMQEPYHYFRTHVIEGKSYLIVGGEDHKTGHDDPDAAFNQLHDYAKQYFDIESVAYQWSAQYYIPVDGLPYIGAMPGATDGTYVATGFNGNGMILGTLSGNVLKDLILGNKNEYANLFSPSRLKPVAGFAEFIRENADVAWHFVADRFSNEKLEAFDELQPGEGKLAKVDGRQLAVYKDFSDKVIALNPVCTHAGCIVQFNHAEQSWDCPCHGGRFDPQGKVLTGPPTKDLDQIIISYDINH